MLANLTKAKEVTCQLIVSKLRGKKEIIGQNCNRLYHWHKHSGPLDGYHRNKLKKELV